LDDRAPSALERSAATGRVRIATGVEDFPHGPYHISRADLASTLLDLVEDSQHVGSVLLVSERKETS
jgi:hypothetical protein